MEKAVCVILWVLQIDSDSQRECGSACTNILQIRPFGVPLNLQHAATLKGIGLFFFSGA